MPDSPDDKEEGAVKSDQPIGVEEPVEEGEYSGEYADETALEEVEAV